MDWIFSGCNPFAFAADVLGRVRQGASKCREGPLAWCAGTAATSSVLLVQDAECAVRWYRIYGVRTPVTGVVQSHVLITPTDTASTLDLICCEAGVKVFRERLTVLASVDEFSAWPQALDTPTRVSRTSTSGCGGLHCDVDRPAPDLSGTTTAWTLGRIIPIVLCVKAVVAIRCLEVSSNRSGLSAGSPSLKSPGNWHVATGTRMLMFGSTAKMVGRWMRGHWRGIPAWV